jgi:hypothetical protein
LEYEDLPKTLVPQAAYSFLRRVLGEAVCKTKAEAKAKAMAKMKAKIFAG